VGHKLSASCLQTDLLALQRYCQHDGQFKPVITLLVIILLLKVGVKNGNFAWNFTEAILVARKNS